MPHTDSFDASLGRGTDWSPREPEVDGLESTGFFGTLRQALFPRTLPDLGSLSEVELIALLNEVEIELLQKGYRVDFLDRLPPRVVYRGLVQMLDSPLPKSQGSFDLVDIDGCDSACEVCFQLAYCPVAREVLGAEWRLALEHAGTNPSWAALYAGDGGLTF